MKYMLIVILFLVSCQKKHQNFEMEVLNRKLVLGDSVKIKLENNTNENYLFYIHTPRLIFSNHPNEVNEMRAQITLKNQPVSVSLSSNPLFIVDEDGTFDKWSLDSMKEINKRKNEHRITLIPAHQSETLTFPFIDSLTDTGGEYYPKLVKGIEYNVLFKMKIDSNKIYKNDIGYINKIKNDTKFKFFQGELMSQQMQFKY